MKRIRRVALIAAAAAAVTLAQGELCAAEQSLASTVRADSSAKFETTIQFSFEIKDLVTDQQFPGQKNSFYVTYEYIGVLKGAAPGVVKPVPADTFPYFETIRNDVKDYILNYKNKAEFYELLGTDVARFVLDKYPQLKWIEIVIDIPRHKPVDIDRSAKVRVVRGEGRI